MTMIYVTHDQVEAMTVADKIVVLNGRRIEQVGAPMDLYHRPETRFVADFIGSSSMNFLSVSVGKGNSNDAVASHGRAKFALPSTIVDASQMDKVTLAIRPEHIRLSTGAGPSRGIAGIREGQVGREGGAGG